MSIAWIFGQSFHSTGTLICDSRVCVCFNSVFNILTIKHCVTCPKRCPGTSAISAAHMTVSLFLCKTRSKEFNNGAHKNHESFMPRIMMMRSSDVDNWISHLDLRKIYSNHFHPSTHNSLIMKLNYSSVTYLHAHFASTITKLCNPKHSLLPNFKSGLKRVPN